MGRFGGAQTHSVRDAVRESEESEKNVQQNGNAYAAHEK